MNEGVKGFDLEGSVTFGPLDWKECLCWFVVLWNGLELLFVWRMKCLQLSELGVYVGRIG
jgi:hypothetical protein